MINNPYDEDDPNHNIWNNGFNTGLDEYRQEAWILSNFLISFHTATWTGSDLKQFFNKMAAYSYSRTNSNGYEEEEEKLQEQTLKNLEL